MTLGRTCCILAWHILLTFLKFHFDLNFLPRIGEVVVICAATSAVVSENYVTMRVS